MNSPVLENSTLRQFLILFRLCNGFPSLTSHNLIVSSLLAENNILLSGENPTNLTSYLCP